jgi:hypothetical protein
MSDDADGDDDELRAVEWEEGLSCNECGLKFSFTRRRHHCRRCGLSFCGRHSSHRVPVR